MASTLEISALAQVKLSYTVDSCSSVSGSFVPNNVLLDLPLEASSRWAGVYHPYPNPSASSASLSKPAAINPIHTAGSTFNPALRFGAGTAEGTLVGERAGGATASAGVGVSEGRNWLMLRLDRPAVLRTIHFGKLHRPHPCTMKTFVVYAGMDKNNLKEILHASLKHDGTGETFAVGWREAGEAELPVTTRFVKIVPLSAQGANYNTSIWYVALGGISDESVVQKVFDDYNKARDGRMFRLMLKHLRQNRLFSPFNALLNSSPSPVTLEHPLLSRLHATLVQDGDFASAEALINSLSAEGLFDAHLRSQPARAIWTRLDAAAQADRVANETRQPGKRAGHRMVADEGTATRPARLYLFGGWDGKHNLDDLWVCEEGVWREITKKPRSVDDDGLGNEPWPSPRSCHSLVLEPLSGDLYLTGRYIEDDPPPAIAQAVNGDGQYRPSSDSQEGRSTTSPGTDATAARDKDASNEFWRFSIEHGERWEMLSPKTEDQGGPGPIYDHEMILDAESQSIYCYGGSDGSLSGPYSGLFRYDIKSRTWTQLLRDSERGLTSRSGHCMLWNPKERAIYIFGGLRGTEYLHDFWRYHPDTDSLALVPDFFVAGGPEPAFTQRAIFDVARNQIVFMSGLRKAPGSEESTTKRGVWVFDMDRRRWSKLLGKGDDDGADGADGGDLVGGHVKVEEDVEMEEEEEGNGGDAEGDEPSARYAYQLAFDSRTETFWLFGGNTGRQPDGDSRLADHWQLQVERPLKAEIERRCLVACRKQKFIEMSEGGPALDALVYLQTQLHAVIRHDDPAESEMFVALTGHLLSRPLAAADMASSPPGSPSSPPTLDVYLKRTAVFDTIQAFIADPTQKEPEGDLAIMVDARLGPLIA